MRRTTGIAAAAVLALGALGAQTTGALAGPGEGPSAGPAAGGTVQQLDGATGAARDAVAALAAHPRAALDAPGQQVRATQTMLDPSGATHVRMERTYRGLPVLGGDLVVHQGASDAWRGVSQSLDTPLDLAVTPTVAASRAAARATAPAADTRSIARMEVSADQAPRLVVDALAGTPRLAWEVVTTGRQDDGTPSRLASYVDARTGQVLRREEQIQTVDGSGQSLYGGTVPLQVAPAGSAYELRDVTRGGTYTVDLAGKQDSALCGVLGVGCATGKVVSSPTTSFGNGTTSDPDSAGVDAQYGTDVTWDYYSDVHGREGIFGDGSGSYNRVHYGKNYVNAFWDGEKMTYGDGDGTNFGPLVSLDVAGHEMSHGVTENTAGLTYSGESGGLNEATSDIFGTMVEFYAANPADPGDYLIGEEFDLKEKVGFRRMDDPIADGSSPNCYSADTKNLDVHYSSGVGNHFFYLLAEGSGAKTIGGVAHRSTTCDGSTVTGIGRDQADAIWFRALTVYMTSGTTYSQARAATLSAARDLYGAGSAQESAVAAAWTAVSVA
ncbi:MULTISPECIES: M4 family metallopeptidase [Nocardioides]|uniref:M4 family metallopeptidase n=1 Tax=Nocardioides TaxID=1839 RepID=UPI00203FF05E|nr:M4 family metallopeptidase [Nocardioides sp. P86]MCM3514131.1 M4 family metallopeptidase [Nocardioides sp. P86]